MVTVSVNRELKTTGAACATWTPSVPTPFTLKLYVCASELFVETVKDAPAAVGVTGVGATVQVGGAPAPQVRFTALAYPFTAFSVPLNVAVWFAVADCGELLIASV